MCLRWLFYIVADQSFQDHLHEYAVLVQAEVECCLPFCRTLLLTDEYQAIGSTTPMSKCTSPYILAMLFWISPTSYSPDANGLFAFMVEQLQQAEDAGQRAWIIGHIPSGKADLQHDFVCVMAFSSTRRH